MYGTWRFDSKSEDNTLIQKPVDPAFARPVVQQACESCRNKKIKCSGERPECSRCEVLSKPCVYSKGSPKRRSTKAALARTSTQPNGQQTHETAQEGRSQSQPSPELNKAREPSPKLQHGVGSASMAVVAANAPTRLGMADFVMTDMMPRPTPDFTMNQDWPSPLGPPEQSSDAASVGTVGMFHNSADMQTSMATPVEHWFSTANAFQSDIGASFLASWPPILEPTHPLPPEITASRIVKPKRLSPGVMPTPTSSSSHDSSTAGSMQASCSCLQHVVFLVHELETAKMGSVDGQMASHKEAVDYGRAMLVCELCSRRPENLMMLTFLSERLLQLSEAVLARLARPDGEERLAFVFGELEIDSAPEWDVLVSSLVALQLGALRDLLGRLKKSAETARADMVYEKVVDAEKLTGELMERLRLTVKPLYAFKYPYSSTL